MKLTNRWLIMALGCAPLMVGCGATSGPANLADPGGVVAEFLEAVRTGNDEKAADLLTPLARQKTSEMEMVVAPPGSETAQFKVCAAKCSEGCAEVPADWTDLDADGRPHTDRIVWLLKHDGQQWRIAGMSTRVFADQAPVVLNFEDPADMLSKQQQAEEEIARRDQQRNPAAPAITPAIDAVR